MPTLRSSTIREWLAEWDDCPLPLVDDEYKAETAERMLLQGTQLDRITQWHHTVYKLRSAAGFDGDRTTTSWHILTSEMEELENAQRGTINELKEICDVIVTLVGYAYTQGYDLEEALEYVIESNNSKLVNPQFNEWGKLLKGDHYINAEEKISQMEMFSDD